MTALLLCFYSSIDSKEFCDAFRDNKYEINYVFKRFFLKDTIPITEHDIIIKGHYWRLQFNEKENSLRFLSGQNSSKECPYFSDKYFMALH